MFRRSLLLLPATLAALAMPVAPALAGDEDPTAPPAAPPTAPAPPSTPAPPTAPLRGSATLHASQGCVSGHRAKATVTGSNIDTVAFYVGGKRVKTVTRPAAGGGYVLSMSCAHLGVGAHSARAAVTFQAGASPTRTTLHFQITRARQTSPQFTG